MYVCMYVHVCVCIYKCTSSKTLTLAIINSQRCRLSLSFHLFFSTYNWIHQSPDFCCLSSITFLLFPLSFSGGSCALHLPLLWYWTKTDFFLRKLEKQGLCDQYVSQPSHEKKGTPNTIKIQPCTHHSTRCFKLLLIVAPSAQNKTDSCLPPPTKASGLQATTQFWQKS